MCLAGCAQASSADETDDTREKSYSSSQAATRSHETPSTNYESSLPGSASPACETPATIPSSTLPTSFNEARPSYYTDLHRSSHIPDVGSTPYSGNSERNVTPPAPRDDPVPIQSCHDGDCIAETATAGETLNPGLDVATSPIQVFVQNPPAGSNNTASCQRYSASDHSQYESSTIGMGSGKDDAFPTNEHLPNSQESLGGYELVNNDLPGSPDSDQIPATPTQKAPAHWQKRRSQPKRCIRESHYDESADELSPRRKRRKAKSHTTLPNQPHSPRRRQARLRHINSLRNQNQLPSNTLSNEVATPVTATTFEEWPLADAMLQRVTDNGRVTFSLQFSWSPCEIHTYGQSGQQSIDNPPDGRREPGVGTHAPPARRPSTGQPTKAARICSSSDELDVYQVKRMLGRWGRHTFFLQWDDGSTGWEPRRNIDEHMLNEFELTYAGFNKGVEILDTRTRGRTRQFLLQWQGRPILENCWVHERHVSRDLLCASGYAV